MCSTCFAEGCVLWGWGSLSPGSTSPHSADRPSSSQTCVSTVSTMIVTIYKNIWASKLVKWSAPVIRIDWLRLADTLRELLNASDVVLKLQLEAQALILLIFLGNHCSKNYFKIKEKSFGIWMGAPLRVESLPPSVSRSPGSGRRERSRPSCWSKKYESWQNTFEKILKLPKWMLKSSKKI